MKKLSMRVALGMAMLAASAAQAATTTTYDFDGFTISFTGSDIWSQGSVDYDQHELVDSRISSYDPATGIITNKYTDRLVKNAASVSFSTTALPTMQSVDGSAPAASSWSFSYAITAKPDWQLTYSYGFGGQVGEYLKFKGGNASVSAASHFSSVGGDPGNGLNSIDNGTTIDLQPTAKQGAMDAGNLGVYMNLYTSGNSIGQTYDVTYPENGGWIVKDHSYIRTDYNPMTFVSGQVTLDLSASTTGAGQIAYLTAGPAKLSIDVGAVRVAPVPEPDTYAMVMASLGAFGFLARRKAKKSGRVQTGAA